MTSFGVADGKGERFVSAEKNLNTPFGCLSEGEHDSAAKTWQANRPPKKAGVQKTTIDDPSGF
jgi:hypothetical protein